MQTFLNKLVELCTAAAGKIILALLIYFIGRLVIRKVLQLLKKSKALKNTDPTVRNFALSAAKIVLYAVLVVSIITVLGVPMASVVTVLATCGVAVGMALQGSLSNLAGGIMLMIFRPFKVDDYVSAAGAEGVVKEISPFYTVITTVDNKTITVPNGSLMNSNVTNFSAEDTRRVDLTFSCAKGEDVDQVEKILLGVMDANPDVMASPAPFAKLSGGTNESMEFTVRAWTAGAKYWDVYFALTKDMTKALGEAGVKAPAVRVIAEEK